MVMSRKNAESYFGQNTDISGSRPYRRSAAWHGVRPGEFQRHTKKSDRVLCQGVAERYAIMKILRLKYSLLLLCRVLEVSRSGYYAWLTRLPSRWAKEEARLEIEIKAAHKRTRRTGGSIAAIIYRLHYDDHHLVPLRRSESGLITAITEWLYSADQ